MTRVILKFNINFILPFALCACSLDISIDDIGRIWDATQTKVLFKKDAFADGAQRSHIQLKVFSRSGTPLDGLNLNALNYSTDVLFDGCSISSSDGIINCYFRSTIPGTMNVDVSDGSQTHSIDVTFIEKTQPTPFSRISFSPQLVQTESNYKLETSLSNIPLKSHSESGYKIDIQLISSQ